ncbi:MAG TPA: ATP-binding cassette domain-containing protein, partial [Deltaproteobacteria bacterium]|nr:ATP-binding cassette domain-containing protein [Deltaproteobacteria bacterium]
MSEDMITAVHLAKDFPLQSGWLPGIFRRRRRFVRAVDDVSFSIRKGRVLGLVGESGSGKTTTGRLVLGLIPPTSGEVSYRGRPLSSFTRDEMERLRCRVQVIFQDPYASLSPRMSVGRAISHPLEIHRIARGARAREMTLTIMEKVGLTPAEFFY